MTKRRLSIACLIVILLSLVFYLIWAPQSGEKEDIVLNTAKEDVLDEIQESKEYVNDTVEWMEESEGDGDLAFFNPPSEHKGDVDPKGNVVKYFIAGLMANDVDIFLSSFHPESISKDLFKSKNPDKVKVAEEIMDRISRAGQLKEIQYGKRKGILNTETNTLTLYLSYKDDKKAEILLDIISLSDAHHEGKGEGIYVITTSAWEIVRQIKNSTK